MLVLQKVRCLLLHKDSSEWPDIAVIMETTLNFTKEMSLEAAEKQWTGQVCVVDL